MVLGSGIRDPGSGKNPFRIPDPGSRGQKGTGSRILDPDPQHWTQWYMSRIHYTVFSAFCHIEVEILSAMHRIIA
jgi:hypothetical protein